MNDVAERPLLQVKELTVDYRVSARDWLARRQVLRAVNDVSLDVARREVLAVVGESGCGKTTLGRTVVRLVEPTAGSIVFDGADVARLRGRALLGFRRRAQMVFQDPYASLNPRLTVGDIVAEPLRAHGVGSRAERRARVRALLDRVGLPADAAERYPNAFSGGQRQRIGIARALILQPDLLVADEPVSALDVSVQAQVVNLLGDLRDEFGLTMLFIAHDLAVVRHLATRVAVMYLGRVVEVGSRGAVFDDPRHPYTQSLLAAVPLLDPDLERARMRARRPLRGDPPSAIAPPPGCPFHTRCPEVFDRCRVERPPLHDTGGGRHAACHLAEAGRVS